MSSNVTRRSAASSRVFAGLMVCLALVLMIAAGVNTGARGRDSLNHVVKSATVYERMISSFVPNGQRRSSSNKAQPALPAQPVQPSQPPQPPQPAPAPPAQPNLDQADQPAPPSPPSATLGPAAPAPPAVPTNATPATPATAPVPPPQEKSREKADVDGKVDKGNLIEAPHPVYPNAARKQQITGTVSVSIVIGEDGNVISAEATDGPEALRGAAVEAAYKARFRPTKVRGKSVKVSGALSYNFVMDDC